MNGRYSIGPGVRATSEGVYHLEPGSILLNVL